MVYNGQVYLQKKTHKAYEFESRQALAAYAEHPAHLEAKTHFWEFLDSRVAADYEV